MTMLEVARLRVAVEDADGFISARQGMLDAFATRPGFVKAELVRLSPTEWLDLVVWERREDFVESRRRGADSASVRAFFARIAEVVSTEEGDLWEG